MTNPQSQYVEPIKVVRPKPKFEFVPGEGMVEVPDDSVEAMLYDLHEAMDDAIAAAKRKKSIANVGFAALKRRT